MCLDKRLFQGADKSKVVDKECCVPPVGFEKGFILHGR